MASIDSLDTSTRPQDDLYQFANGGWLAVGEIPADRARYGAFDALVEASETAMRKIVETAADAVASGAQPSPVQARVGALYASFMDTATIDQLGWAPLGEDLAAIAAVADPTAVVALSGRLEREGVGGLFGVYVTADAGDPEFEVAYVNQAGLGLPDEAYYRADEHAELRTKYVDHMRTMFSLAAPALADAGLDLGDDPAARVMALETKIAAAHWDKVAARDAVKSYNPMTRDELDAHTTGFDWSAWATGSGAADSFFGKVIVGQPDMATAVSALLTSEPIGDWRAWMTIRLIGFAAPYLPSEVSAANFDFYGRTLSGVPEQKARWKRGVAVVESLLGEDAGQLYVADHFPEQAADRMSSLVDNVLAAFRRRIGELTWMGDDTRQQALVKLEGFRAKIGRPERWRDYSGFDVRVDDLIGNVKRGNALETDRQLAKIGQPVDGNEWFMTPQTVNAYYHPIMNEIVFPAAILQPPFFDADADDASNYGGIGAVIAHEIGHGFDDQGSRFDARGELRDWWTRDDRAAFDTRANALIAQFDQLSPRDVPGATVNGALTVGENIGDLCGLELSNLALRLAHPDATDQVGADGWTDQQRFFVSYGQLWRTLTRPEEAERLLSIDPHSPPDLRANVVRNVDAFHEAFETQPDDGMWLSPDERVRVF